MQADWVIAANTEQSWHEACIYRLKAALSKSPIQINDPGCYWKLPTTPSSVDREAETQDALQSCLDCYRLFQHQSPKY